MAKQFHRLPPNCGNLLFPLFHSFYSGNDEYRKVSLGKDSPKEISLSRTLTSNKDTNYTKETTQSTDQTEDCYYKTISQILKLLKELGIQLQEQDVEDIQFSTKTIALRGTNLTRMTFGIDLSLKELLPSEMDNKVTQKVFSHKQIHHVTSPVLHKAIELDFVEKATIKAKSRNSLWKNKSNLKIQVEIDTAQTMYFRREGETSFVMHAPDGGMLSRLFDRKKWRSKPLQLKTFASSSSYFGCLLAILSSVLCGLSFVLKKQSLLESEEDVAYYMNRGWWMAHSLMVIGDVLHFIAFLFTSAVLICTLQMLMVLVVAVASSCLLGEKVNKYWKLGFATSLGGCWVIIVHIPKEPHIHSIDLFLYMITAPTFAAYSLMVLVATLVMIQIFIPKWGQVNSLAYTLLSAIFGSVAVVALKGVLLVLKDRWFHWLPITSFLVFVICLLLQLEYLNRALTYYNSLVVTTQYYVLYSALVIMASFMLFEVWKSRSNETIVVILLGFATTTLGVLIFAIFQEDDVTFDFSKLFRGPEVRQT